MGGEAGRSTRGVRGVAIETVKRAMAVGGSARAEKGTEGGRHR